MTPDLFGDTFTRPVCAGLDKRQDNAAAGFLEFWQAWPKGPRKVAKVQCLDKWARLECADCAELILRHVEWLKTQDDWLRGFVPLPMTYLNQRRWLDWDPPVVSAVPDALAVLKAHKGDPMPESVRQRLKHLRAGA